MTYLGGGAGGMPYMAAPGGGGPGSGGPGWTGGKPGPYPPPPLPSCGRGGG